MRGLQLMERDPAVIAKNLQQMAENARLVADGGCDVIGVELFAGPYDGAQLFLSPAQHVACTTENLALFVPVGLGTVAVYDVNPDGVSAVFSAWAVPT